MSTDPSGGTAAWASDVRKRLAEDCVQFFDRWWVDALGFE